MPRRRRFIDEESESESEFSETDVSFTRPGGRTTVKRRSFSRVRRDSPNSNAFLTPAIIAGPPRRSASTGGRRRRGDDPIVVVDVHNDVHAKQDSRDHRRNNIDQRLAQREDDIEEIDIIRSHRRPRIVADIPASRTPSPRQQQRDWELLMDQRILANNDVRQDRELAKQQQEIENLERQLAKSREKRRDEHRGSVSRRRLAEEEAWEDELAQRLRKLDVLEQSKRTEEEQKLADYRSKIKRLEDMERKAAEEEEAKRIAQEKHLKEVEKREKIKAERDRIIKEIKDEEARKALEEEEHRKEMAELKRKAIEEWKQAEEAKKMKEIEEQKARDKEFRERLRLEFGYSEEEIEKMLKKKHEQEEKKEEKHEHHHHGGGGGGGGAIVVLEPPREKTTFIRVHRKYLLPATLDAFKLPWDWDDRDGNYIIIKQWISEDFQEELFAHTRRLRGGKLIEETSTTLTELKVNDRKRDKMYLVRKKNPGKSWIFT
uniref:Reticulocyte-binding protein 2 like a n=1 Tax=Talaromyces marneffei PM1 TaxID=1077442 RepID=A0A093V6H5_TALMA